MAIAWRTTRVIAITGALYGDDAARDEVSAQIDGLVGSQAAEAVEEVYRSRTQLVGPLPTLLGIAVLLFGATTVVAQTQSSLNQFWGVVSRPSRTGLGPFLKTRLVSLGLVLVLGFLLPRAPLHFP